MQQLGETRRLMAHEHDAPAFVQHLREVRQERPRPSREARRDGEGQLVLVPGKGIEVQARAHPLPRPAHLLRRELRPGHVARDVALPLQALLQLRRLDVDFLQRLPDCQRLVQDQQGAVGEIVERGGPGDEASIELQLLERLTRFELAQLFRETLTRLEARVLEAERRDGLLVRFRRRPRGRVRWSPRPTAHPSAASPGRRSVGSRRCRPRARCAPAARRRGERCRGCCRGGSSSRAARRRRPIRSRRRPSARSNDMRSPRAPRSMTMVSRRRRAGSIVFAATA